MPPLRTAKSVRTEQQPALDAMGLDRPSVIRNIIVGGKRTCLRVREAEWAALDEIASREGRVVSDIITEIDRRRGDAALAAAVRVFAISYFRIIAQDRGMDVVSTAQARQIMPSARKT